MRTIHTALPMAVILALSVVGCVSRGKYDEAVAQTNLTQAELGRTKQALAAANAGEQKDHEQLAVLQSRVDELTQSSELSSRDADSLRGELAHARMAHAAAEARAALFRSLALKLKSEIDSGNMEIVVRDGRMVLVLPNDVLFDTGRTAIKPAGQAALKAIAGALKTVPDRHFQIAGHTDDVPIHNERFSSNWELSTARALGVVHFLMGQGVTPGALSAAGYADVDPVAGNESPEGRRKNRRTEITLEPNINGIVQVP